MKMKKIFVMGLLSASILWSCGGGDDECVTTGITYDKDIKTLFTTCTTAPCHGANSAVGSMATYAETKAYMTIGRTVQSLKHEEGFSPMPKGLTKFSDCNIAKVEAWYKAGMPEK